MPKLIQGQTGYSTKCTFSEQLLPLPQAAFGISMLQHPCRQAKPSPM